MAIEVLRAGVLTTIQDLGRNGQQRFGIQPCGAMDPVAHRIGNALVGNEQTAASLEMTIDGPTLRTDQDLVLALTGADCAARVGAVAVPRYRPLYLRANGEIRLGVVRQGARSYLAFRGGIDIPLLLGSRSTDLRGKFGGHEGRALKRGDRFVVAPCVPLTTLWKGSGACSWAMWFVRDPLAPYSLPAEIRFVPGRHWEKFHAHSRELFVGQSFHVGAQSDRMGYRLQGPSLQAISATDELSEPVARGSIQIPPDGQPIVLMADRQTVGGYPRIGEVATVDLPRIAQLKSGDQIRFKALTRLECESLLLRQDADLAQLEASARARWTA